MNSLVWNGFKDIRPSINSSAQAKISAEHKNLCRELFENFGKKLEATADRWAWRLVEADFTMAEVKAGLDYVVLTCEKLPSFTEFVTVIRNQSNREDPQDKADQDLEDKAAAYRQKTELRKEGFIQNHGEDKLYSILNTWWTNVYGTCPESYGLPIKSFLPIFFDDLQEAMRSGGGLNEAIEISKGKL